MKQTKNFRFGSLSLAPFIICLAVTVALARKSPQEHKHDRQYPMTVEISRQQRRFEIIIKLLQPVWLMYVKNWLLLQLNLASSFALASYLTMTVIVCSWKQAHCWMRLKLPMLLHTVLLLVLLGAVSQCISMKMVFKFLKLINVANDYLHKVLLLSEAM